MLANISFNIARGDFVGILGPNGSGKTTLMRLILGLLSPVSGEIKVFEQLPRRLRQRYRIGYVPQRISQEAFIFPSTVQEVVQSGRTAVVGLFRAFTGSDKMAVDKAMRLSKISHLRQRRLDQLSGGERQRVFIARALAGEPELLILDEPTIGVDVTSQETFYGLLCELNNKHALTILLVSHDIDVVAAEAKTVLLLNRKLVGFGPAKQFMNQRYLEQLYQSDVKFIAHRH